MPEKTIYQMIEEANQKTKEAGHFTFDWKTWGGSSSAYGFYHGINTHTKGYTNCAFCKKTFSLDVYDGDLNEYDDCPMNPNKNLTNTIDESGYGITTWSNCYLCGRPLSSKPAMLRGTCSDGGCTHASKMNININKKDKFNVLSKLPKENSNERWPIFNCVMVKVENGKMTCNMFKEYSSKDDYNIVEVKVDDVLGNCEICVPRNTFVDVIQLLVEQGENISINLDKKTETMIVSAGKSVSKIKGISYDEFLGMI